MTITGKSLFSGKVQQQLTDDARSRVEKMSLKKEIRAAKWFSIVLAVFALCWLPLHIMNLVTLLTGKTCVPCTVVAVLLSHTNSAINPILYAYSNSKFHKAFRAMMKLEAVSAV
jgi:Mg/Co/Ni transporter MgtE